MLPQNPLGRAGLTECFAVCWGALFSAAGDLQVGLWVALQKNRENRLQTRHPLFCAAAQLTCTLPTVSSQDLPVGWV